MVKKVVYTTDSDKSVKNTDVDLHVFFLLAYIFWRSGSDMLSQNFQVSSDYACDMLIFVCFPNFFSLFKICLMTV